MATPSIQQRFFSDSVCFGCGPMNPDGLRIESWEREGGTAATFEPTDSHQAGPGFVNGGIISTVLDCHAASVAWLTLVDEADVDEFAVVTKEMTVRFTGPTPVEPVELWAEVTDRDERRATVAATLSHDGAVTAELDAVFVRVPKQPSP